MSHYHAGLTWSLLLLTITLFVFYRLRASAHLPPGPPPKFFTGNIHQLPRNQPWKTYAQWSQEYGPIFLLRVFRRKTIILNTHDAVMDLLEKKSSIYSDRPVVWMYKELVGRKWAVFNISGSHPRFKDYKPLQEREALLLLKGLYRQPDKFISHIRRNAGAVILQIAYGWTVNTNDDYFVSIMEESFNIQAELVRPGKWLVDSFPLLRFIPSWFPGVGFQRQAAYYREQFSRLDRIPHSWSIDQMKSGTFIESFTSKNMRSDQGDYPNEDEEDIIRWCSAALYAGGADTTVAALTAFFLLMALYPEVQQRAQDEISSVVGNERLPTLDDRDNLPYVNALLKETLRWSPVAPLGLPHSVTQNDTYLGYSIPKDSMVFANIWALTHNPDIYPDPSSFSPERFIRSTDSAPQYDPTKYVFGFGRRVCPGAHFAEVSLFLNISNILATFSIYKARSHDGLEITPPVEFTSGTTSHPKPFPCRIVPRATASILSSLSVDN